MDKPKRKHHGLSKTLTYDIWAAMKARCGNPRNKDFKNYGGRGIRVCDRWLYNFPAFFADMGECPSGYSIDRVDPNGHYEPSNCRWIPMHEQSRTKRDAVRTREAVPEILRLRSLGYSQDRIAASVGINQATVSRILVANGLRSRVLSGAHRRTA